MKAVEIVNKENKFEITPEQEYQEFCKKRFNLEVGGAELLALIAFAASSFGHGFSEIIYDFYDDNKDYLEDLKCYNKILGSVSEFNCKHIEFN